MRSSLIVGAGMASILAAGQGPAIIHSAAYANTLTNLLPDLYAGLDVVSRELVGFLPSVSRNAAAERAAVGESVRWPIVGDMTAYDTTAAMAVPEPPDAVLDTATMTITKSRAVPFGFTGEEQRGLNNSVGYLSIQGDMFAQALRTLVNEMERDVAIEAAAHASRAYGTAGTTPFSGDKMTDAAAVRKMLDDNGAPATGRSLIINTAAGANLRSMYNLTKANEAGTTLTLRQGELLDLMGLSIKESAGVDAAKHTSGTAASATTDNVGYAVGARTINLASAGTGTVLVGDYIMFAGDTNKYLVTAGDASTANGGPITIARPGLRVAIPAVATAVTLAASFTPNVAFSADALRVAMRPPAIPVEGDLRMDSIVITDPRSGVSFEVSVWPGYRKVRLEVALAWGVKAVKDAHIVGLLG